MVQESWWKHRQAGVAAAVALVSSLLFVALASQLPVAILSGAGHDDAWFWLRATSIAGGGWLGGYDQHTLIKGSGYPLLLAANHALGMSLATSQALLYSLACLLLGHAVHRVGARPGLALVLVLAIQWHPAALTWTRVLRDNVSAAQVLLVLACLLQAFWTTRARWSRLSWAGAAGASLAWFWTTREDGVWLLPGVAVLLLAGMAWARRDPVRRRDILLAGGVLAAACLGWLTLVATVHRVEYGEFVLTEIQAAPFADAVDALQSVRVGQPVPFVPVPGAVREAVYEVSPRFARLRPMLEAQDNFWIRPGCSIYPDTCGDYAGGWFIWALRDAAAAVGAHASAPEAAAFYRGLAEEVGQACADGRLQCRRPLVAMMPPVTAGQWRTLPERLGSAARLLVWRDVRELPFRSHLDHPGAFAMWDFVGRPRVPDDPAAMGQRAVGWLRDPAGGWLQARCEGSAQAIAIERRPSADVAAHFDDPAAAMSRFAWRLPPGQDCRLELLSGAGAVDLSSVDAVPRQFALGEATLNFDGLPAIPPTAVAATAPQAVKAGIWRGYAMVLPWLAAAGLCGFAWAMAAALRRRRAGALAVLAMAAWGLVASRTLVLALVDLSAFPAINHQYLQGAFPLLVLACIASLGAALERRPAREPDEAR